MSLNLLWQRLMRRPVILAMIIVFAGVAGYAGWNGTTGEVQSRAGVLVVPPWFLESEEAPNPVLNLTERTTRLASALVTALQTNDTAAYLGEAGATGYTASNIGDNLRYPEPTSVIQFAVTAPTPAEAHAGTQRLIDKSRQVLERMQIEAAVGNKTDMAKLQVIVPPQETVSLVGKQQIRAAAVFAATVILAGLLLCWIVEAILDRRSRSRSRSRPENSSAGADSNRPSPRSDLDAVNVVATNGQRSTEPIPPAP